MEEVNPEATRNVIKHWYYIANKAITHLKCVRTYRTI